MLIPTGFDQAIGNWAHHGASSFLWLCHALLQQQVHRFIGVIDRFGSFVVSGDINHTVCVHDLCLASSPQSLEPGHWWFPLHEIWLQASIQLGDNVLYTAKN